MSLFRRKNKASNRPPTTSSNANVVAEDEEGVFSPPLATQPTMVLCYLIGNRKWDEASKRCRDHPDDLRWKDDYGYLPIHRACYRGAPLNLIRQLHEAYGEGIMTATNAGLLPMHYACAGRAPLEVIRYLHEAYGQGIRTATNYGGQLAIHKACRWGASLDVIRYLHAMYPDGATKKNMRGKIPAILLEYNEELSEEYKVDVRDILSNPPRAPATPPRPTKHTTDGTRMTTSADPSTPISTSFASATATVSFGSPTSLGYPSSPVKAVVLSRSVPEVFAGRTVDHRGDEVFDHVVRAPDAAIAAREAQVALLDEEVTAAEGASRCANAAVEKLEAAFEEGMAAVRTAREAEQEAIRRHEWAKEEVERLRRELERARVEVDAANRLVRRKREESEVARGNVQQAAIAAPDDFERKRRQADNKVSAEDNEGIKTFLESKESTLAARTLEDMILNRQWPYVAINALRIDRSECKKLFFLACRWGPSTEAVESFLQVDDMLPRMLNLNQELPIHVLCRLGAERGAIETLVRLYHHSLTVPSGMSNKTPLGLAQSREWIHHKVDQAGVILLLRRESFAQHFDGMTDLPRRPGFDLWAHIHPSGLTGAKALLLYIDMAGFTAVNNNAGHTAGDSIIKKCTRDMSSVCSAHASSAPSEVHVPYEVYRMGGDEFAIVCKFVGEPGDVWTNVFEELACSLADLNYVDEREPPRYSTFLRIGCAAGSLSNMDNILSKADELQKNVKDQIGLARGKCVTLSEIRGKGKKNVSDLSII